MDTLLTFLLLLTGTFARNFTVSGLGSGGYMATQLHVAYSGSVSGVGVIGSGPYYCAMDSEIFSYTMCKTNPYMISLNKLFQYLKEQSKNNTIDQISNLKDSSVYIVSGTKDSEVIQDTVRQLEQFYRNLTSKITTNYNIPAEHAWITAGSGNPCGHLGSPWVAHCNVDISGAFFQKFYTNASKGQFNKTRLHKFSQAHYIAPHSFTHVGMAIKGLIYYPNSCNETTNSTCKVHVALHDCEQSYEEVGDRFMVESGLLDWAEGTGVITIFPQAGKNNVKNPLSCWDYWGYTGSDYALKSGAQMSTIYNMTQSPPNPESDWLIKRVS